MIVEYGKISNGLDDVAKYLGLDPKKTIFLHSTSFDESDSENLKRKAINKGRMIYSEILSYSSDQDSYSMSAISYFNKKLLNLLEDVKVICLDNIVQVSDSTDLRFPFNSVSTMLNRCVKENSELREKLDGFTIVSSYLGKDDEETAKLINGNLIMNPELQVKFNSKYEFRKMAKEYGFSVPDGDVVVGLKNFEVVFNEIKNNENYSSVWVKLENQSSGKGNLQVEDIKNVDVKDVMDSIIEMSSQVYDEDYIMNDMPFIIEVDVNSSNEVEVSNIGVEAVVADGKVTIIGGVEQATKNGVYLGSKLTEDTYKYLSIAQDVAKDAFIAVSMEGYRGFMTIDVLVTRDKNSGEIRAYNIDPNARFSAGTMLLKNIHTSEKYNNKKMYGLSFASAVPKRSDDVIDDLINYMEDNIYNKNGDYTGIIPALINDINEIDEGKYYLKSVVIDESYEMAEKKFAQFKNRLING